METSASLTANLRYVELQVVDEALNVTIMLEPDEARELIAQVSVALGAS